MPSERCVICLQRDDITRLIAACRCYKKSDSNRVHAKCLEQKFEEHQSDEPLRCPKCREPYSVNVSLKFKFAWARCLTLRSMGHAFEFFIVVIMIFCGAFTLKIFRESKEVKEHPGGEGQWLIYILFGITLLLIPVTLAKVFERWKKANAKHEILPL